MLPKKQIRTNLKIYNIPKLSSIFFHSRKLNFSPQRCHSYKSHKILLFDQINQLLHSWRFNNRNSCFSVSVAIFNVSAYPNKSFAVRRNYLLGASRCKLDLFVSSIADGNKNCHVKHQYLPKWRKKSFCFISIYQIPCKLVERTMG